MLQLAAAKAAAKPKQCYAVLGFCVRAAAAANPFFAMFKVAQLQLGGRYAGGGRRPRRRRPCEYLHRAAEGYAIFLAMLRIA